MPERIVHVTISGLVQGVGYRAWVEHRARGRGLKGWVRNRANGDVEAVFAGEAEDVAAMCEACRNGPRLAQVDAVEVTEADAADLGTGAGDRFRVLGTV
jgi:acylphosphatase